MPATYWSLNLTMNPTSGNGSSGRFEPNPELYTAPSSQGPWTLTTPPNTAGHFQVQIGDFVRVALFDQTNTLANVQSGAVFGRDNARGGGASKSSPFVSAGGRVNCVLPAVNQYNVNNMNVWVTADWAVQSVTGQYRFVVYAVMKDSSNNQYEFGHDPEMDVAGQK